MLTPKHLRQGQQASGVNLRTLSAPPFSSCSSFGGSPAESPCLAAACQTAQHKVYEDCATSYCQILLPALRDVEVVKSLLYRKDNGAGEFLEATATSLRTTLDEIAIKVALQQETAKAHAGRQRVGGEELRDGPPAALQAEAAPAICDAWRRKVECFEAKLAAVQAAGIPARDHHAAVGGVRQARTSASRPANKGHAGEQVDLKPVHGMLRAMAVVMKPILQELLEMEPNLCSPAEAVTLNFLEAAEAELAGLAECATSNSGVPGQLAPVKQGQADEGIAALCGQEQRAALVGSGEVEVARAHAAEAAPTSSQAALLPSRSGLEISADES